MEGKGDHSIFLWSRYLSSTQLDLKMDLTLLLPSIINVFWVRKND